MPRPAAHKAPTSRWGVHPSVDYSRAIIQNYEAKTGRTLDEWVAFTRKHGPKDEKARREWLKTEHQAGMNMSWWIAELAAGRGYDALDPAAYLAEAERCYTAMFTDKKAHLLPISERLLELGWALGSDVKACPCKTMVPLYRTHVFAQIKPATNTRIDFGLALGAQTPFTDRLLDTGGLKKKDRITHRIALETVKDIDKEVQRWLKVAYSLDA